MALLDTRRCIFCGSVPEVKTREHVLPYWLLEKTGDPLRVVTFAENFSKGKKPVRFSWSNYVAPACKSCNERYSELEGKVKHIISSLEQRTPVSALDYATLLDWLDKVRTGIWLLQHMLDQHPMVVNPHFHINQRVGMKDRMLAVYAFDGDQKGLNPLGHDTLIFKSMPCCFGLRINSLLLINASTDFMCSPGCGLPHPKTMTRVVGGPDSGKVYLESFVYERDVRHPITSFKIPKPVVWLYQPIKMPSDNPLFQGGFYGHANIFDSRISKRSADWNPSHGALFRQYADEVQIIREPDQMIEFDEVIGDDTASLGEIIGSMIDLQCRLFDDGPSTLWVDPPSPSDFDVAYENLKRQDSNEKAAIYRRLGEGE